MKLSDYQELTRKTAIYPKETALPYLVLGLVGEAGEIANKYKKVIRDDGGKLTQDKKEAIAKELGDVLWYMARIPDELGVSLDDVAQANIEKLLGRKEKGTLQGSGDDR